MSLGFLFLLVKNPRFYPGDGNTHHEYTSPHLLIHQNDVFLISKFESKDMLLWKGDSAFIFTEDEILWILSSLMWFDGTRHPKKVSMNGKNTSPNTQQKAV